MMTIGPLIGGHRFLDHISSIWYIRNGIPSHSQELTNTE
uniref:Uncharacterized protein n=1 Tax=Tetranychus urticae TaxID=32264 RepID=T1JUM3_TETUR